MPALEHQSSAETGDKKPQRQSVNQRDGDDVKRPTECADRIVVEPVNPVMEWESSVSMVEEDQRSSEENRRRIGADSWG